MKAGNFLMRSLTFAVGVPLFIVLVYFLPHLHHLALSVLVTFAAVAGGLELAVLLRAKGLKPWAPWLGAALPAAAYLEVAGLLPAGALWVALLALLLLLLLRSVFVVRAEKLEPMLGRISASLLTLLYPGLFLAFLVRISGLPRPTLALAFFFCLVFLNDLLAYTAGMLARGWSRLHWPVSPKKSAVGFACGLAAGIGTAAAGKALFPAFLPVRYPVVLAFGAVIGALVILGDLVESVLKRSSGVKDSSSVIPGRGGVLDSIDSWLLAAPAYYLFFRLIG